MEFLKTSLRTSAPLQSAEIATVSVLDIAREIKPVGLRLATAKDGRKFMHFITEDGSYLTIRVNTAKVQLPAGEQEAIQHLLDDCVIYTGEAEHEGKMQRWFRYSRRGEMSETKVFDFAAFAKGSGKVALDQVMS